MKLIVGLGNPGKQYEKTRHNIGWLVLDMLVKIQGAEDGWQKSNKANAEFLKININGQEAELVKPLTFMNKSGEAVLYAVKKHNLKPEDIIIVHDDKDIIFGDIKVQKDRSSAGHNGVQNIIDHLHSQNFTRIRIGVALEDKRKMGDTSQFVLRKFGLFEKKKLKEVLLKAEKEIEEILNQ